ncbi:hypothetical protein HPHPP13_1623 [Helicobacter pylori Hp P-13]|nr:hypothetical protein HPHPP13_1623 [Helicobacter pylori Hp P-13]
MVFANEPTIIFNLRDYLLVLAQIFNQQAICYCEQMPYRIDQRFTG